MKLTIYDRNQQLIRRRDTVQSTKSPFEVGTALDSRQLDTGEVQVLVLTDATTKWFDAQIVQVVVRA